MTEHIVTTNTELLEVLRKATENDEIVLRGDATFSPSTSTTVALFTLEDSVKLKAPMLDLQKVFVNDSAFNGAWTGYDALIDDAVNSDVDPSLPLDADVVEWGCGRWTNAA